MKTLLAKLRGLFYSKTFWFNFITGVLAIADKLTGTNIISDKILAEVVTVGNIILRFVTNKALENK